MKKKMTFTVRRRRREKRTSNWNFFLAWIPSESILRDKLAVFSAYTLRHVCPFDLQHCILREFIFVPSFPNQCCFSLLQLLPLSNLFISDLLLNNYQTSIFFFFQITTMILNNVEIFKKNIFELKLKINFEMSSLIIFELNSNIENYEKICNYVENKNASQC